MNAIRQRFEQLWMTEDGWCDDGLAPSSQNIAKAYESVTAIYKNNGFLPTSIELESDGSIMIWYFIGSDASFRPLQIICSESLENGISVLINNKPFKIRKLNDIFSFFERKGA